MSFQSSFYSSLYDRFLALQPEGFRVVRLIYYDQRLALPHLSANDNSAIVLLPRVRVLKSRITYGTCAFLEGTFGEESAARLVLASACLVGTKAFFYWFYRQQIARWIKSRKDFLRASYVVNCILDTIARRRIKKIAGNSFYKKVITSSDILSFCTLSKFPSDLPALVKRQMLAASISKRWRMSRLYGRIAQPISSFFAELDTLPDYETAAFANRCRQKVDGNFRDNPKWELEGIAESLLLILEKIPGKWDNNVYLSYSNTLDGLTNNDQSNSVQRLILEKDFDQAKDTLGIEGGGSEAVFQSLFELMSREQRDEKAILNKLSRASIKLNFESYGFPQKDYSSFLTLYNELSSYINLMIQRANLVKNATDESQFQESGNIDLQIAIQAIASGKQRDDMFVKDEDILKSEVWTILIDSSKSMHSSSETLKAAAVCLAETAKEVMGSKKWGMFAFSDKLQVIKYYDEAYDRDAKARIGGLRQEGLSHIPDAMRAIHGLAKDYLNEKNYVILVSDGIPSGYLGIEEEFSKSVRESGKIGAHVGAIGLRGNRVHESVRISKAVEEKSDIVKAFIEVYAGMSY